MSVTGKSNFKGLGCYSALVEEWMKFKQSCENCIVIQRQSMSGIASMRITSRGWEIELGS